MLRDNWSQSEHSRWRVGFGLVLLSVLVLLALGMDAIGQPLPQPPPCGGPGQPLCSGISISSDTIGPGPFPLFIIVINATLAGSVTCENNVIISSSGPPVLFQDEQIIPALIEIPPDFPQGITSVLCRVPISTGVSLPWLLTLQVCGGSGQQPCPYALILDMATVTCETPGQEVTLQATVANGAAATPIYSITGDSPWLTLTAVSPGPPVTLDPGEQIQFSMRFTCNAAGTFRAPFIRL